MQDQPLACFQVRFWSCDVQMILSRPGAALRGLDGCSVYILPLGSSCAVRLVFPRSSWLLFGFCDSLTALWLELRLLARPNCPFREPLRDGSREKNLPFGGRVRMATSRRSSIFARQKSCLDSSTTT